MISIKNVTTAVSAALNVTSISLTTTAAAAIGAAGVSLFFTRQKAVGGPDQGPQRGGHLQDDQDEDNYPGVKAGVGAGV